MTYRAADGPHPMHGWLYPGKGEPLSLAGLARIRDDATWDFLRSRFAAMIITSQVAHELARCTVAPVGAR